MTIYLDIVFFENILLNYIIILSTAIICKSKINYLRILLSSSIGGIFVIFNYLIEIPSSINILTKILLSVLMILIAFKETKIIRHLSFFYLISFMYGGLAFMLLFFIKPQNVIFTDNHLVGTYPIKVTIIAGFVGLIIIIIISKIIKNRILPNKMICDVEIVFNGKIKKIKSMIDTGNLLKEPISNADVVVVEKKSLEELIPKNILENITSIISGKITNNSKIYSYKLKVIPFSSLGNENGMLIGFKPDYVKIFTDIEVVRDDVLIGIYDGKLSKNNIFTGLIGLNILENGKGNK